MQFRQTVIGTVAIAKDYYYQLIYFIDALGAAQKSLQLAQRLLEENEIRVKVGTMAPLDVVQAQSEVAGREEAVIVAENDLYNAEDNLKRQIFPENDPAMWHTRIIPTDRPSAEPDAGRTWTRRSQNALENRTDIVAARKALERSDYAVQYYKNQLLPDVNLVANYGGTGAGGTQLVRDSLGGPVISTIPGGYGDAVSEVFGNDYPTWQIGVNLAYAIPNRSAKAASASARISKDQALASFRRLEMTVAAEVRTAARGVESGFKRVQSTQAARVLQTQRLDAEEKKFAAGMSTNFLVTQAQRDLANAEVARAAGHLRLPPQHHQLPARAGGRPERRGLGGRPQRQPRPARRPPRPSARARRRRRPRATPAASSRDRSGERGALGPPLFLCSHRRRAALDMA